MADVFSATKRSEIMARVKGKGNVATEGRFVQLLRKQHIAGWRRNFPIFGRPDFTFPRARVAIFIDGCFWHGCPRHSELPGTNRLFWLRKLTRNKVRDRKVNRELRARGWRVVRVWQHELLVPNSVAKRIWRVLPRTG